jgi:cysteine desulfurase
MIYLDNNATTRPLPAVVDGVAAALTDGYGNPSSVHGMGQQARKLVDLARTRVAGLLQARETEIIFTSGATESINTAVRGAVEASRTERHRVVITAVEHEAVHDLGSWLGARGAEVIILPVDELGRLDLARVDEALSDGTTVVSVMLSNNETGVVFPVAEIARMAKDRGIPIHVDAVQAVGKVRLDVQELGVDFLSLSGHKFHAPKGTGVLYARRGARWRPLIIGAGHEGGRRGGTENVPGIVGLGIAAEHMANGIDARCEHLTCLSRALEQRLLAIPGTRLNGDPEGRVPGTVNISFKGIEGSAIILTASREGVHLSAGSACSAAQYGGSHVLEAMAVPFPYLHGSVRLSCAETTTEGEVQEACRVIEDAVTYLRAMDPAARS